MRKQTTLKIITALSIAGMGFSGWLSYGELFRQTCSTEGCSELLGLPTCTYGFAMYLLVFITSTIGLRSKK